MKQIYSIALAVALSFGSSLTSTAGPLDGVVQITILDGERSDTGTYSAALRLTLADGWKTYWRAPGDAGIPPRFDWRGSNNVESVSFTWPTPSVFKTAGLRTLGYKDQLVLPVEITPRIGGKPVQLKGRMELGVCSDICIPAELNFNHKLDPKAARNPAIVAALASRPFSESEAGVQSVTCRLTPSGAGMKIEARIQMPPAGGSEIAVIEPGNPEIWASEPKTQRQGNTLVARSELVHVTGGAYAIDRSQVRITVLGSKHAVDIQGCKPG
ncbi:MAG: protein-disulfide reductase DsbD domain-containing protein [Paracoccaceae bacterium]